MLLAALAGLGIVSFTGISSFPNWIGTIGLLSIASVFFSACRFAIVPEAARQGHLPLPHVQAIVMLAVSAGTGVGIWIGFSEVAPRGMPLQLQAAHAGFGLAIVALMFARFQPTHELLISKGLIGPFLTTAKSIMTSRKSRHSLFALLGVFALLVALDQWLIPNHAHQGFALAVIIGLILGGLHGNAYRTLGRVPFATVGLSICSIWGVSSADWYGAGLGMAVFLGIMIVPLLTTYQIYQPESSQGHGAAILFAGCGLAALGLVAFLISMRQVLLAVPIYAGYGVMALSLLGLILAWLVFFRPALETAVEWLLWPFYRVRASGPGAPMLPWRGPYVMIANHAAWFDPLWLEKILPAPTVPMMTSKYYDLRVISWFMRNVFGTIRVPDVRMREMLPRFRMPLPPSTAAKCWSYFRKDTCAEKRTRNFGGLVGESGKS